MSFEDNSIKDPLDFAANLTIAATEHTLKERSYALVQKQIKYKAKVQGGFDPNFCEECGDDMPKERQAMFEVLCTSCKTAVEVAEKRRRM